jgi:hypothetical protein
MHWPCEPVSPSDVHRYHARRRECVAAFMREAASGLREAGVPGPEAQRTAEDAARLWPESEVVERGERFLPTVATDLQPAREPSEPDMAWERQCIVREFGRRMGRLDDLSGERYELAKRLRSFAG